MSEDITTGELSRQLAAVLQRFEALANRLNETYVTRQVWDLASQNTKSSLEQLDRDIEKLASKESVEKKADVTEIKNLKNQIDALEIRVKKQEENVTWLVRTILAFVILAILGTGLAAAGLSK